MVYHDEKLSDIRKWRWDREKRGKVQRYRYNHCGKTFNEKRGTVFEGLQHDEATVILVVKMYVEENSVRAIERITGIHRDRIRAWLRKVAEHCYNTTDYVILRSGVMSPFYQLKLRVYIVKYQTF